MTPPLAAPPLADQILATARRLRTAARPLVEIWRVRQAVRLDQLLSPAPTDRSERADGAAFDDALRALERRGEVRLVALTDWSKSTAEQRAASLTHRFSGRLFFYVDVEG